MAAPKKSTSTANSAKQQQRIRVLDGKTVKPTLYDGQYGKYMAATINDQILRSDSGRPIEYKNAGKLQ